MILIMPLPQMLQPMISSMVMTASSQLAWQLVMALGARIKPIRMMIGPVTTGGNRRMTRLIPNTLISAATTTYSRPAITIPPHA